MDTPTRFFASPEYYEFIRLNGEIFSLEQEMKKLGYEEVRLALYRARITLGHEEQAVRSRMAREDVEQFKGESL